MAFGITESEFPNSSIQCEDSHLCLNLCCNNGYLPLTVYGEKENNARSRFYLTIWECIGFFLYLMVSKTC